DRGRHEVIEQVRHDTELANLARYRRAGHAVVDLILTIDAFEFDTRTDEVVADHATGSPAGLRRHAEARDGGVQQPVHTAFRADVHARRRSLRLGHDRQRNNGSGGQQSLFHELFPSFIEKPDERWRDCVTAPTPRAIYTPQLVRRKERGRYRATPGQPVAQGQQWAVGVPIERVRRPMTPDYILWQTQTRFDP